MQVKTEVRISHIKISTLSIGVHSNNSRRRRQQPATERRTVPVNITDSKGVIAKLPALSESNTSCSRPLQGENM